LVWRKRGEGCDGIAAYRTERKEGGRREGERFMRGNRMRQRGRKGCDGIAAYGTERRLFV